MHWLHRPTHCTHHTRVILAKCLIKSSYLHTYIDICSIHHLSTYKPSLSPSAFSLSSSTYTSWYYSRLHSTGMFHVFVKRQPHGNAVSSYTHRVTDTDPYGSQTKPTASKFLLVGNNSVTVLCLTFCLIITNTVTNDTTLSQLSLRWIPNSNNSAFQLSSYLSLLYLTNSQTSDSWHSTYH